MVCRKEMSLEQDTFRLRAIPMFLRYNSNRKARRTLQLRCEAHKEAAMHCHGRSERLIGHLASSYGRRDSTWITYAPMAEEMPGQGSYDCSSHSLAPVLTAPRR